MFSVRPRGSDVSFFAGDLELPAVQKGLGWKITNLVRGLNPDVFPMATNLGRFR